MVVDHKVHNVLSPNHEIMPKLIPSSDRQYTSLLNRIGERYQAGRAAAITSINRELLLPYWEIGWYIVEFEQEGKHKATYGTNLLQELSKDLRAVHGSGLSRSNLEYMRKIYLAYPISQTLSGKLSWSHYVELLILKNDTERSFYEQQCITERWSVRELKRQKETSLYHRLAASKSKEEILEMAKKGRHVAALSKPIKPSNIHPRNQQVNIMRPLVGNHGFEVGHVAHDRVLRRNAHAAVNLPRFAGDFEGHVHVVALAHTDLGRTGLTTVSKGAEAPG